MISLSIDLLNVLLIIHNLLLEARDSLLVFFFKDR